MRKRDKVRAWRVLADVHADRCSPANFGKVWFGLCGSVTKAFFERRLTRDQHAYLMVEIHAELRGRRWLLTADRESAGMARLMYCQLMALAAADAGRR